MAHHTADKEQLSRDELALMAAFEACTGDGTSGTEGVALSPELQAELNDLVLLTQRIADLDDVPPMDPTIRGRLLSAAVAHRDEAQQPRGLAKWLLTLLRPAPIAAMGLLAAVIVAVGVRPDNTPQAGSTGTERGRGAMVALERPASPQGAAAAAAARVAPAAPPIVTEGTTVAGSDERVPPAVDKAAGDNKTAGGKATEATARPRDMRRQKLFAAHPASLGPAKRPADSPTDRLANRSAPRREKTPTPVATAAPSAARSANDDEIRSTKTAKRLRVRGVASGDNMAQGKAAAEAELAAPVQKRGEAGVKLRDRLAKTAPSSGGSTDASKKGLIAPSASAKDDGDVLRATVAKREDSAETAASHAYATRPEPKPSTQEKAVTRDVPRPGESLARKPPARAAMAPRPASDTAPTSTSSRQAAVSDAAAATVETLRKQVSAAKTAAAKRAALLKLKKFGASRGLKTTVAWATQQLAALDAADASRTASRAQAAKSQANRAAASKAAASNATPGKATGSGAADGTAAERKASATKAKATKAPAAK